MTLGIGYYLVMHKVSWITDVTGADLGGGCRGCAPPPPPEMTCGFLIQQVFCKKKTMWFIGVEVEQETSAPLLKKILDLPLCNLNPVSEVCEAELGSFFWNHNGLNKLPTRLADPTMASLRVNHSTCDELQS